MKEVGIYIAASVKGRWSRNGYIGYVLEYYPENSKYPKRLINYEQVQDVNENRAQQEALIRALARMREKCALTIYTESAYLYNGFAGESLIDRWIRNGWKTAGGTEVKNRDKWSELMKKLQGNLCRFYLDEPNAYTAMLKTELKRLEDGSVTLEMLNHPVGSSGKRAG